MSLAGKVEAVVKVKSPAGKFHEVFSCKPRIIPSMSPQNIQGCDLLEDQLGNPGCIICWIYFHDVHQFSKEKMEIIDNENYITNYKAIEGDLLEKYKSFCATVKVTAKEDGSCSLVHWTFEYEKLNKDVPDPSEKLQMAIDAAKDIDASLLAQKA